MGKLNIIRPKRPAAKETPLEPKPKIPPTGWWRVSTEYNEDGRLKDLGVYYGHLAAVAFGLGDRAFRTLQFTPYEADPEGGVPWLPDPEDPPKWRVTRERVSVRIEIKHGGPGASAGAIAKWLDAPTEVAVSETSAYGAVELGLLYP